MKNSTKNEDDAGGNATVSAGPKQLPGKGAAGGQPESAGDQVERLGGASSSNFSQKETKGTKAGQSPSAKRQAIEALRDRIEEARRTAGRAEMIRTMIIEGGWTGASLEELERRAAGHKLGTNCNGWVNPYPTDDPRSLYLEYQFAYSQDKSRFKCGLMSRQTGKDFSSEGEAAEDCFARPKTEWMIAGPSERQALDSLDQGKMWAEGFDLKVADYVERRESGSETLLKSAEIIFSNGSRMRAVPGKPDTVRGRSANLILTEFDFFENPAATWRAILPSITNPLRGGEKRVRLITTPNGAGGAMHKIWEKDENSRTSNIERPTSNIEPGARGNSQSPIANRQSPMRWSRHLVTIYHAVLMGLPVDIAQLREAFDDPDGWLQEFCCQFLDGSNVLLPYDVIGLAESAEATECWNLEEAGTTHPTYCGIDFGRTNDPTVCWTLQQVGDVLWTREVLVLRNVSTPEQEQILRDRVKAATRSCFDYTGPGIGLGDYLVKAHGKWKPEEHEFGKVETCTFTAGFKRLIFPRLRKAFTAPTRLRVPISVAIREDLHEMMQVITNGEYNYWSKRTREGHSDRCTALALAVRAAETGGGMGRIVVPGGKRSRVMAERRERSVVG